MISNIKVTFKLQYIMINHKKFTDFFADYQINKAKLVCRYEWKGENVRSCLCRSYLKWRPIDLLLFQDCEVPPVGSLIRPIKASHNFMNTHFLSCFESLCVAPVLFIVSHSPNNHSLKSGQEPSLIGHSSCTSESSDVHCPKWWWDGDRVGELTQVGWDGDGDRVSITL